MSKKVTETSSSKLIELVKNELKNKSNVNHNHTNGSSLYIPLIDEVDASVFEIQKNIKLYDIAERYRMLVSAIDKNIIDYHDGDIKLILGINNDTSSYNLIDFQLSIMPLFQYYTIYSNYNHDTIKAGYEKLQTTSNGKDIKLHSNSFYVIHVKINNERVFKVFWVSNYSNMVKIVIDMKHNNRSDYNIYTENYYCDIRIAQYNDA